jgi:hypothetical protein
LINRIYGNETQARYQREWSAMKMIDSAYEVSHIIPRKAVSQLTNQNQRQTGMTFTRSEEEESLSLTKKLS